MRGSGARTRCVVVEREHEAQQLDPRLVAARAGGRAPSCRCHAAPCPRRAAVSRVARRRASSAAASTARAALTSASTTGSHAYCWLRGCASTDAISLRSRRRKFGLFLETMRPTPETTVLDVGVDDARLRRDGTPAAARSTSSRSTTRGRSGSPRSACTPGAALPRALPGASRTCRATRSSLPFGDGEFDVVFSNAVIEHVGGASRAAALRRRAAARRAPRLRDDAEPLVPARGAHAPAARPLAARAGWRIRAYDLARKPWAKDNHLLGPGDLAGALPGARCASSTSG